jgi:hypothetical protein
MITFRWEDLWYSFVIFAVAVLNVVIDNYLIILLILLVYLAIRTVWRVR